MLVMSVSPVSVSSLFKITQYPFDISDPIFTRYPLFKLGVHSGVRHYAQQLAPLVEQLVISTAPHGTNWVLSAPPYKVIPAAANFLCWNIYDVLREKFAASNNLSLIDIRERKGSASNVSTDHITNFYDYSKFSKEDRIKTRERESANIIHENGFRDRAVIFINDIKVTGAQQRVMHGYFSSVKATTVHWVYLIDVEPSIGACHPQLENEINYSALASFEEYAHLLATENMCYTSKCIWRLFAYSVEELEQIFSMLEIDHKEKILELALAEDFFHADFFVDKIKLLKAHCEYAT